MTSPSHGYRYTLKRHRLPDANNWLTLVTNTGGASVQITAKAGAELANAATSAANGTNGDLNRYMWWRPPKAELARVASCKQFLSQPSNVGCLERTGLLGCAVSLPRCNRFEGIRTAQATPGGSRSAPRNGFDWQGRNSVASISYPPNERLPRETVCGRHCRALSARVCTLLRVDNTF